MIKIYVSNENCAVEEDNNYVDLWEKELTGNLGRKITSFTFRSCSILVSLFLINYVTLNKLPIFSEFYFLLLTINYVNTHTNRNIKHI